MVLSYRSLVYLASEDAVIHLPHLSMKQYKDHSPPKVSLFQVPSWWAGAGMLVHVIMYQHDSYNGIRVHVIMYQYVQFYFFPDAPVHLNAPGGSERALQSFVEMQQRGFHSTAITYRATCACGKARDSQRALQSSMRCSS